MSKVSLKALLPVLPLCVCIEEGRARLFDEGNDGEYRVSDQGSASGHTESYSFLSISFVSLLNNASRGILHTLLLLSLFIFAPAAVAGTYYVSTSGSNSNPGTISSPFGTLQRAHDIAVAGDTIYLRGGTYNITSGQKLTRDGTSGNPIKVFAYPGEFPVLDASQMTQTGYVAGFPLSLVDASWWHIRGLEIKNGPEGGLVLYPSSAGGPCSSNNIIEDNDVHHNGRLSQSEGKGIIAIGNCSNNLFLNNDSHHNADIPKDNADGFAINGPGTGNVLRGNRAWRNSDDGYDFFNSINNSDGGAITLEGNWAWENGYNDNLQPQGEGNGFKLGGRRSSSTGTSGGHIVKNNVSWKNKQQGFVENVVTPGEGKPMIVYNNTAWSNGGSNFLFNYVASTFRNNLSFGGRYGDLISSTASNSFNSWNLPVTVNSADFASLDFTGATGPRNADGSLPTINLLRLATGSDLIDKGVNVGIAYTGSAPDLGAYEYGGSVTVLDTTPPTVPTGLTAVASASQVSLSWNASSDSIGVTGYRVYRNGTQIAALASNSYIDGNLVPGTYSYTVAAVDAAGNVSAQSGSVSATVLRPPGRLRLSLLLTVSPLPSQVQAQKAMGAAPLERHSRVIRQPSARDSERYDYV